MDQIMSESNSNGEEPTAENLAARVRDLEADVYGFSNDEESAGQQAVVDVKRSIVFLANRQEGEDAVALEDVWAVAEILGLSQQVAEQAFEKLRRHGEVYEPADGEVRTI